MGSQDAPGGNREGLSQVCILECISYRLLTAYMQARAHRCSPRRTIKREERHPTNTSSDLGRTIGRSQAYRYSPSVYIPRFCHYLTCRKILFSRHSYLV